MKKTCLTAADICHENVLFSSMLPPNLPELIDWQESDTIRRGLGRTAGAADAPCKILYLAADYIRSVGIRGVVSFRSLSSAAENQSGKRSKIIDQLNCAARRPCSVLERARSRRRQAIGHVTSGAGNFLAHFAIVRRVSGERERG